MTTLSFTAALEMAEAQARASLDTSLYERLSAAIALVKDGAVFQRSDGSWEVDSATTEGITYAVNGTCPCDDVHYNKPPHGLCKHRLSVYLARRVQELLAQPPAPIVPPVEPWPDNDVEVADPAGAPAASAPQPLYEAPASATVRLQVAGHADVLFTLRDLDETRLLQRLEAVLERFPLPQAASQPPAPLSPQQTGWCGRHDCTMHLNTGKDGRQWWSHKLPEGGFCKGK